ncbi:hypothetical protein [Aquiflexum lacus]|uniref:hypothetical protein n=1 Tax=Aquiflexum lacus TaxID=2483805 RepID=UPI001893B3F2|nr:hypothetical protein [Aquiflexum lacus]
MKKYIQILTLFLISLSSCEINQEIDPEIDPMNLDEVREVLKGHLYTPEGKLKSINSYQFEFDIHVGRQDWYYDESGKVVLTSGTYENDTTGVSLYFYNGSGLLVQKKSFYKRNGDFEYVESVFLEYDENGRIVRELNSEKKLIRSHTYNESGLLVLTQYGENQDMEKEIYEYDEFDRIFKYTYMGGGESPILLYYYRYNSLNQLEAKEAYGLGSTEREDAFQYFYNDRGQLVEEKEFYPQWDFVPKFRKVYEYYTGNNISKN